MKTEKIKITVKTVVLPCGKKVGSIYIDAMFAKSPMGLAKKQMDKDTLLEELCIAGLNGKELYIRDNGEIRESTMKEFMDTFEELKKLADK